MLPKEYRVNLAKDFARIKRSAQPVHSQFFTLLIGKNQLEKVRAGFVVSSKVGKAHDRSRSKRRLRELVSKNLETLPKGADLVFIAKGAIKEAKNEELTNSFNQVISKIS